MVVTALSVAALGTERSYGVGTRLCSGTNRPPLVSADEMRVQRRESGGFLLGRDPAQPPGSRALAVLTPSPAAVVFGRAVPPLSARCQVPSWGSAPCVAVPQSTACFARQLRGPREDMDCSLENKSCLGLLPGWVGSKLG